MTRPYSPRPLDIDELRAIVRVKAKNALWHEKEDTVYAPTHARWLAEAEDELREAARAKWGADYLRHVPELQS
jgi:hypothetical protein